MGDTIDDGELNKVAEFFLKYSGYDLSIEKVKEWIKLHFEYKTAFVMYDGVSEIAAICRWNIVDDGKTADIQDLYIREDWRGQKIIQQMLLKGLWIFPSVKQIRFERIKKYPGREFHTIPINKILKRR